MSAVRFFSFIVPAQNAKTSLSRRLSAKRQHALARNRSALSKAAGKGVNIALILALLSVQVPAAPAVLMSDGAQIRADLGFAFLRTSNWLTKRRAQAKGRVTPQEKQSDREAKVTRVEIRPSGVTINNGDRLHLTAIPYDSNDQPRQRRQNSVARQAGDAHRQISRRSG
jgi:hypothetical protein